MEIKKFKQFESNELTGWVNVKIDNQIFIRMSRYIPALDKLVKSKFNLFQKIDALSKVASNIQKAKKKDGKFTIRDAISIICILQYLKEIRDSRQFNPSSSGFLLEGFLATLVYGRVRGGYGAADISSQSEIDPLVYSGHDIRDRPIKDKNYQIKLYNKKSKIKVNFKEICDYYVICLKDGDEISVHILTGHDMGEKNKEYNYIGDYAVKKRGTKEYIRIDPKTKKTKNEDEETDEELEINIEDGKKYIIVNTDKLENNKHVRTLNVGELEDLIQECGEDLKKQIKAVYDNLSELHYDIDSIVIGRDKDKKEVDVDSASEKAFNTIRNIEKEVAKLKVEFKKD